MPRPRKVPPGSVSRSVLFRAEQAAALEEAGATIGAEVSDLIRAAVDVLFPAGRNTHYAARTRIRAALEIRRREIAHRRPLVEAVWAGLAGGGGEEPEVSAGRVVTGVVRDVVRMLRALPSAPVGKTAKVRFDEAEAAWDELAQDWAAKAALPLLEVLASPAVWCHQFATEEGPVGRRGEPRPRFVFAALSIAAGVPDSGASSATVEVEENQYRRAISGVAEMVRHGVLEAAPPDWPWSVFCPFPVMAYAVHWDKTASVRARA